MRTVNTVQYGFDLGASYFYFIQTGRHFTCKRKVKIELGQLSINTAPNLVTRVTTITKH